MQSSAGEEFEDDDDLTPEQRAKRNRRKKILGIIKMTCLLILWLFFTIPLIAIPPHKTHTQMITLDPGEQFTKSLTDKPPRDEICIDMKGAFDVNLNFNPHKAENNSKYITMELERLDIPANKTLWSSKKWELYLENADAALNNLEKFFHVQPVSKQEESDSQLLLKMSLYNSKQARAFLIEIDMSPIDSKNGVIYSIILIVGLYVLIIWEITDRTFAALLASTAAIAILALMDSRPTLEKILSWVDVNTLMLLFGMMILVGILSESGVFDYLAIYAYKMAKGHAWPLIFFLCMFTGLLSAFLDNVTMVLLMTPVTIRLCEVMSLHTTAVLICVVLYSNIGGTLTPVGDPPNVIIATNPYVCANGIGFMTFTAHMFPGVFLSMIVAFAMLYLLLRKKIFVSRDQAIRNSINLLKRQAAKVQAVTEAEEDIRRDILRRHDILKEQYKYKKANGLFYLQPVSNFIETLAELQAKYQIRNKPLLIKSCIAMGFALALFFLHSLPFMKGVTLAWTAILAALLLLILANKEDMQLVLASIEWATLLFFAALFVLMEALAEMGLIDWIGKITIGLILSVQPEYQTAVGLMILLWISAITSAFVDNIPITTMMLRLTIKLAKNEKLNIPLAPLIWALAFGSCFGGNGTLIGASANVVTAGIASQHGYKMTFMDFFVIGFPVMLVTIVVASLYLLIAHCALSWH